MFGEKIVGDWEPDGLRGGSEFVEVSTDGVPIIGGWKPDGLGGGSEFVEVSTDGVSIIGGWKPDGLGGGGESGEVSADVLGGEQADGKGSFASNAQMGGRLAAF